MLSSQLMQLVKSLTKHDLREMRKVVRSPYFNQREDVILLYDFIEKNIATSKADFSKEKVFKTIFPNKKYDDTYLRQIMSYLYKIIQNYLITEGVLQDDMSSTLHLLQAYQKKNIDKLIEKQIEQSIYFIENQQLKNALFHYSKYNIRIEEYEYFRNKNRSGELHLQSLSDELDYFYLSERLRQSCILFAHQTHTKQHYNQPFIESIVTILEKIIDNVPISVSVYFYTYKTLVEPENEQHFQYLKKIIIENGRMFSELELKDIYVLATNYCIRRLNNGEKQYALEILTLYKGRIKDNVLLENEILPYYTYKNVLTAALKVEEYAWAETFLNDFKQYLPEKERENIFEYNLALYYFRVGKYKEAMPLLQKVNLNDVLYNLDARRLLARIYYEQNEINPLMSLIESAKVYLHRQKGIGYHHEMYANYFRFMDKMLKIDMKNANARKILRGEVEKTQLLAERDWLLQVLS
jgi:hypothetical protein